MTREFLTTGAPSSAIHLLLAHGAGAPMTSPFLEAITGALAGQGLCIHRFEFAYMARRRSSGIKSPPPPIDRLDLEYLAAASDLRAQIPAKALLLAAGKSMGGRVATRVADQLALEMGLGGVAVLGYPFHPDGRPERTRTAHLASLRVPTLIVQGTRDKLGGPEDVQGYALPASISLAWIPDGDHDLAPRRSSGRTQDWAIHEAARQIATFAHDLREGRCAARANPSTRVPLPGHGHTRS